MALDLRALAFIVAIILLARPITVYLSLLGTQIPRTVRTLVAFTGPRSVVLVAVAELFGERLVALGIADGAMMAPLAFGFVRRGCAGCFDRWGDQFGHATWGTSA